MLDAGGNGRWDIFAGERDERSALRTLSDGPNLDVEGRRVSFREYLREIGRQDKRTASFAAVCGRFSIRYAYGIPALCQPLALFRVFLQWLIVWQADDESLRTRFFCPPLTRLSMVSRTRR